MTFARTFSKVFFGLAMIATILSGCAEPVADIDRTQPNRLKKSSLEGEWYMRHTVVDVNGTNFKTFAALEGDGERIIFQFEENLMLARRAHPDVPGLDDPAANIPRHLAEGFNAEKDGSPIGAWVVDQFDVLRSYNAATGEQSNTIIENRFDRHWNEREWIRTNWMPAVGLPNYTDFIGPAFGAMARPQDSTEAPTWFVECQAQGSEEFVDCDADNAEVSYIDIKVTFYSQPEWSQCFSNFFSVPGLFYADCGTERSVVRTSFAKIRDLDIHGDCADCDQTFSQQNDYQPRFYDDYDDKRFGFFRMNRALWDRRWRLRDENVRQLAQLRAIWHRFTDGQGNVLPYHERTPKPVVYYLNTEHPYDLMDEMGLVSADYDIAFRRIVFALSNSSGGGQKYATLADVPRMFYICSNPGPTNVLEGEPVPDHERERLTRLGSEFAQDLDRLEDFYAQSNEGYARGACVRPGEDKNMGDVRYSFFNFITGENQVGPLGYGPSSADPISGELINGTSNAYGSAIDYYAQYLLDLINIVNGDLEAEDVGYGRNVKSYFEDLRARLTDGSADMSVDTSSDLMSTTQNMSFDASMVMNQQRRIDKLERIAKEKLADPRVQMILNSGDEFLRLRSGEQLNAGRVFKDTAVEQKLLFPEVIEAARRGQLGALGDVEELEAGTFGPLDTSDDDILEKISPIRGFNVETLSEESQRRDLKNLQKRIHMAEDFFDPRFLGWAREGLRLKEALEAQGLSFQEVQENLWYWVRGKSYLGLQEHEVGHSLGLRHNFAGSTDALNFFPQYWALRQQTFQPDCDNLGYKTFDATGLATRRVAPADCDGNVTAEAHAEMYRSMLEGKDTARGLEFPAGLETYATSSIMEYGATFGLNDQAGLALYDYAALAYGYGDLVEVFNQPPNKLLVQNYYDADGSFNQTDSTITRSPELVTDMDDVDLYDVYNAGVLDADQPIEIDRAQYGHSGFRDHGWSYWHYSTLPIMFYDADQAPSKADTEALQLSPRISFDGIGSMWKIYDRTLMPRAQAEAEKRVIVPYKYCEDIFAGSTSYDCMRWDTGADNLEVLTNIIDNYNNYHPVNDFRRGRLTFGLYYSFARVVDRVFGRALRAYQFWLLDASSKGFSWYGSEQGGYSSLLAAIDAINFLGGIMTRPSVGTYAYSERQGLLLNFDTESQGVGPDGLSSRARAEWDFSEGNVFTLDLSNGARFQFDQFVENAERERPYYFPFMMETFSHFYQKLFAMQTLITGSIDVLGADTNSNNTSFFIQPTLVFKDEIFRYFAGIVNEDFNEYIGVCVETDDEGNVLTRGNGDQRALNWKPIDMIHTPGEDPCSDAGSENWRVVNPYTRAFGNADFNMRYYATYLGAVGFMGNLDYDWKNRAGLYIEGRGETPALNSELEDTYETWRFIDTVDVAGGLTYVAYCPNGYQPGLADEPRPGCDLIDRMHKQLEVLQRRRVEEAITNGDLFPVDVGEDALEPANPELVAQVLARDTYRPNNFGEYFDLASHVEMARFHMEILSRIW